MRPVVVRNSRIPKLVSWFFPVAGITLWPFIFIREGCDTPRLINHESIHIKQYNELFVVGFLVLYIYDWIHGLIKYLSPYKAYRQIRLEQEAYMFDQDADYQHSRAAFAWRDFSV